MHHGLVRFRRVQHDVGRAEGRDRVVGGVKEVRRLQVAVQTVRVGIHLGQGNGRRQAAGRGVGRVQLQLGLHIDELAVVFREAQVIDRPGDLAVGGIQLVVAGLNLGRHAGQGRLGDDRAPGQKAQSQGSGADADDCGTGGETHGEPPSER
ncbi:hypothetical protein D3C85_1258940 [compost metagenome]